MNKGKTRSSLLGLAGAYLLYIAYGLYKDKGNADTTMSPAARILFIVLFAAAAAAILVYALLLWRRSDREDKSGDSGRNDSVMK